MKFVDKIGLHMVTFTRPREKMLVKIKKFKDQNNLQNYTCLHHALF